MKLYAAVMLGGALGSAVRYALALGIDVRTEGVFPWGTLTVNILGSFLIGLCMAATDPDGPMAISATVRAFLMIGVFGGFTTFSSFSLQTVQLMQADQWLWAAGNVLLSVVGCLSGTFAGFAAVHFLSFKA